MEYAGPLWLGPLSRSDFCKAMLKDLGDRRFGNKERIGKLISFVDDEREAPLTYYVTDFICDKFNWPIPPLRQVTAMLRQKGFTVVRTHFHTRGLKTNAEAKDVTEAIRQAIQR